MEGKRDAISNFHGSYRISKSPRNPTWLPTVAHMEPKVIKGLKSSSTDRQWQFFETHFCENHFRISHFEIFNPFFEAAQKCFEGSHNLNPGHQRIKLGFCWPRKYRMRDTWMSHDYNPFMPAWNEVRNVRLLLISKVCILNERAIRFRSITDVQPP